MHRCRSTRGPCGTAPAIKLLFCQVSTPANVLFHSILARTYLSIVGTGITTGMTIVLFLSPIPTMRNIMKIKGFEFFFSVDIIAGSCVHGVNFFVGTLQFSCIPFICTLFNCLFWVAYAIVTPGR